MCSSPVTVVSPSATRPASTKAAVARTSDAVHRRAHHVIDAANQRVMALGRDVRAQAHELVNVAKAARKEVFGDDRDAIGHAQGRRQDRFVVGRDAGIRQRRDINRREGARGPSRQRPARSRSTSAPMASSFRSSITMWSARASTTRTLPPVMSPTPGTSLRPRGR